MQSSTSSTNAQSESAGRFPEENEINKSIFEGGVSQVYTGPKQVATTFAGYFNPQSQRSMAQSPFAHGQPRSIASSAFDCQTLAQFNYDFLNMSSMPSLSQFPFNFAPDVPFSSSTFQHSAHISTIPYIPLTTPSTESMFSWAPDDMDYRHHVDEAAPTYIPQLAPMNEFDFGVNPTAVVSSDMADFYIGLETSVASTNSCSSIDDHALPPLCVFSDHDSDSEVASSPGSVNRELRPLPLRSTRTRRTRANPRWSPLSDQTESDHDYHSRSSTRKRRAAAQVPWHNATKRTEKRDVDDSDLSLTIYEQPLILRCPGSLSSGCNLRFGSIQEASSHCQKFHSTRKLCCPFGGCGKTLTALGDLQRHVESLTHTPMKEQRCLTCLKSFTRIDAVKRHCVNARGGHLAIHEARVKGGVVAVCDHEGVWSLKVPEGFKDTCRSRKFAVGVVSWTDPEPTPRGRSRK
ncbi:hypothetical protein L218DRAFT_514720 [Marasmius fiardii PR-910]|nr:hypothetical protein L218DRAFT_514720 [Marasmius fiardii PR-910]